MTKRNLLTLASTAVFLAASTAFAGLDLGPSDEMFQYRDSIYTWDKESGGAVRVGAVWDGFAPAPEAKLSQEGDYIVLRDESGRTTRVGAVWDGAIASQRAALPTLALKR